MIKRALLSVSDKTGIVELAQFLVQQGVEIISTGGTAALLAREGIALREVREITGMQEMLDGRVKTLHPAVHGGLLARRDLPEHMQVLAAQQIEPIDLLVVNLYPFEASLAHAIKDEAQIEEIDIGGPAMIRSAAKNHSHVAVVVDPADYAALMDAMRRDATLPPAMKTALAAKAFARTASYDAVIAAWMSARAGSGFADYMLGASKKQSLRYGENAHQQAALYSFGYGVAAAEQLQGKELSYNNLNDTDAAWQLVREFSAPAVALIKHANPCGVAVSTSAADAFVRALACDPQSAYGGILATNCNVDEALVEAIGSLFLEVIIAPGVDAAARVRLASKKNLRVLCVTTPEPPIRPTQHQIKAMDGGYLLQTGDNAVLSAGNAPLRCVSAREATVQEQADMRFAFTVAKHVKSNAIVLARDGATIGIGAGQMSRVDAVDIACRKAARAGLSTQGAVMASDAFLPFADNVQLARDAGISGIIHPGGSVRDAEVIAAADAADMAMLLTDMRHFKH